MKTISLAFLIVVLIGMIGCSTQPAMQQPAVVARFQPVYPFEQKRQGISGEAQVEFVVDTEGNVRQARVVAATNEAFGLSALACIYKWKFKPGIVDGRPVNTKLQQSFTFAIN
jgi:protein TonB